MGVSCLAKEHLHNLSSGLKILKVLELARESGEKDIYTPLEKVAISVAKKDISLASAQLRAKANRRARASSTRASEKGKAKVSEKAILGKAIPREKAIPILEKLKATVRLRRDVGHAAGRITPINALWPVLRGLWAIGGLGNQTRRQAK